MKIKYLKEIAPKTFKIDTVHAPSFTVTSGAVECIDHKEIINKALKVLGDLIYEASHKRDNARFEEKIGEEDVWIREIAMLQDIERILKGEM